MALDLHRPAPANITGVIGASQTGKGMYCKGRLRRPFRGVTFVWSWLEETDRYGELLGARPTSSLAAVVDRLQAGERNIVFVPVKRAPIPSSTAAGSKQLTDREYVEAQFNLFCRIVWTQTAARCLVEELKHVTRPSWAPPAWADLSTAGAHHHLELIATAQRPTMIDKDFLGNCTEIRCYRCNWPDDAKRMSQILRVEPEAIMDLADLHFVHRVTRERETARGVQPIVTPASTTGGRGGTSSGVTAQRRTVTDRSPPTRGASPVTDQAPPPGAGSPRKRRPAR